MELVYSKKEITKGLLIGNSLMVSLLDSSNDTDVAWQHNLIPYSLFLIPYSLFLIPYSLFLIPYSLFLMD